MKAALDSARRLGRELAEELEGLDEDRAARRALAALAEAGLCAWCVPARWGGAASAVGDDVVSVRALVALRRELAYASGMLDVMLVMQGLGSYPVALAGSDALRAELLPRVVAGECIAAFALTEPGAGSSLNEISSRAVPDGDGWLLNGHKTYISNAGIADIYSVLARTGEEDFGMFLVPGEAPGLTVERFEVMAPHPIGEVRFDSVRVLSQHVLRPVGGLEVALATLARFRTTVAAAACGFARRALDESLQRLASRRQFGKPLAANQGLRFDLAEMDTRLRAAELLVDEAATLSDAGHGWDDGEAAMAVARAKLFATETASWICDRAVQHHGGSGVRKGTPVERLLREVRALRIYEGTSEIQKLIIAKRLLSGV